MLMYREIYTNLLETTGFGRWEFEYNNLVQCVFPVGNIKHLDWFSNDFVQKHSLLDEHLIGAETVPANTLLEGHTDYFRKSNLLINVGKQAKLFHHNNGKLEETVIPEGGMFLLNTQKTHGSNNTDDYNYEFLTVNTKLDYDRAKEYLGV